MAVSASLGMYLAVAAGGACGAMLRYSVSLMVGAGVFGIAGPMATILVNIAGSAMMGLLAGATTNGGGAGLLLPEAWRGFVMIGFLGALTTFSSFALDAGNLLQKHGIAMAGAYIAASVILSLAAFGLCFLIMRVVLNNV